MAFSPMLAGVANLDKLEFPLLASPKLDGVRCLIHPDLGPVTRAMRPIPNVHIRTMLSNPAYRYMDGEILIYKDNGTAYVPADFGTVQGAVMSGEGQPLFLFNVFDDFRREQVPFQDRLKALQDNAALQSPQSCATLVHHEPVYDLSRLMALVEQHIEDGHEGTMLRDPLGHYKQGRSTTREGLLSKVKRFHDDEAIVIGVEEMRRMSDTGRKVPAGTLGALVVKWRRKQFRIGTGFDDATRAYLWRRQDEIIGQTVTFRFQEIANRLPRFPVFAGMRYDLDESTRPMAIGDKLFAAIEAAISPSNGTKEI